MKISKRSPRTGTVNTMDLNVTQAQIDAWQNGALIQHVMPQLTRDEREFLISGYTPEDWKETFGDPEEE